MRSIADDRSRWRCHVERFAPWIDLPLVAITRAMAREWWTLLQLRRSSSVKHKKRKRRLEAQTLRNILNLVRLCFDDAVKDEDQELSANPFSTLKLHRSRKAKTVETSTVLFPVEQFAGLGALALLPERWLVAFSMFSGVRQGEQWSLRLADVADEGARILVTLRFGSDEPIEEDEDDGPRKNGKVHTITLPPRAADALRRWLVLLPIYAARNPEGFVFPSRKGTRRCSGKSFRGWRYLEMAVGRHVRWHDLRHTFATSMVAGWFGPPWTLEALCVYLDHSSVQVTEKYARLAKDLAERAVAKMAPLPVALARLPVHIPLSVRRPRARRRTAAQRGKAVDNSKDVDAKAATGENAGNGAVAKWLGNGLQNRVPAPEGGGSGHPQGGTTPALECACAPLLLTETMRANGLAEALFRAEKRAEQAANERDLVRADLDRHLATRAAFSLAPIQQLGNVYANALPKNLAGAHPVDARSPRGVAASGVDAGAPDGAGQRGAQDDRPVRVPGVLGGLAHGRALAVGESVFVPATVVERVEPGLLKIRYCAGGIENLTVILAERDLFPLRGDRSPQPTRDRWPWSSARKFAAHNVAVSAERLVMGERQNTGDLQQLVNDIGEWRKAIEDEKSAADVAASRTLGTAALKFAEGDRVRVVGGSFHHVIGKVGTLVAVYDGAGTVSLPDHSLTTLPLRYFDIVPTDASLTLKYKATLDPKFVADLESRAQRRCPRLDACGDRCFRIEGHEGECDDRKDLAIDARFAALDREAADRAPSPMRSKRFADFTLEDWRNYCADELSSDGAGSVSSLAPSPCGVKADDAAEARGASGIQPPREPARGVPPALIPQPLEDAFRSSDLGVMRERPTRPEVVAPEPGEDEERELMHLGREQLRELARQRTVERDAARGLFDAEKRGHLHTKGVLLALGVRHRVAVGLLNDVDRVGVRISMVLDAETKK